MIDGIHVAVVSECTDMKVSVNELISFASEYLEACDVILVGDSRGKELQEYVQFTFEVKEPRDPGDGR